MKFLEGQNGPYKPTEIVELASAITTHIDASDLTKEGKAVRKGQVLSRLGKCVGEYYLGLKMVNRRFSSCDIYINVSDGVISVEAMIADTEGDCYDLDEAMGKIEWMIPVDEIYRRARDTRDNASFDDLP